MTQFEEATEFARGLWQNGFGGILRTPMLRAYALDDVLNCEVWVKMENLQVTGSFKERGAFVRLSSLSDAEKARGVVAASAGNHAQGVARHGAALGIDTTIFMPMSTPSVKVNATRMLGASVELSGSDFDETKAVAHKWCEERQRFFVHPFDDPFVMAGQGTIAWEMLEDVPALDTLVIPVGGGGLAAGMALAARKQAPHVKLIGVQADIYPSTYNALKKQNLYVGGATLAEGIAVREPGKLTLDVLQSALDDVLLVSEREIERALNLYLTRMHVLPEGAGAAGLAALLTHADQFEGKKVGLVLSGGNIDTRLLSSLLLRDLARSYRLARFRIELLDVPGQLSAVSDVIGQAGGNVTDVSYHKTFSDLPAKVTYIDISLEAQDNNHMSAIFNALVSAGFKVEKADY